LKITRKAALEAELKSLSAEIEADDRKIAELPGLVEKIQEEATSAIAEVNNVMQNSPSCLKLRRTIKNGWRTSTRQHRTPPM
jgi:predicted RNase H-like nuclease (RuvC/YqgF family)